MSEPDTVVTAWKDLAMATSGLPDGNWWVDDPVDQPHDDLFGRGPFVARAAELLDQIGARASSTVVGLVGPWGSGKTSTIHMIVSHLDQDSWGVTWINPWALSGPDAVVTELLGAIRGSIPEKTTAGARARRSLERYGVLAAPVLSAVPIVGSAAAGMAKEALDRATNKGTLEEQSHQVTDALSALARPILIVIDDVDRLQPEQLLAVFRAVRVLGRLPYVHYVLAYDQQTVLDVLGTTPIADKHGARAVSFLEKIVTLRLEQPPVRIEHAESLFNAGLAGALGRASASLNEEAQRRLVEERESLLLRVLTEPRSVARLLTQIDIYLPLVGASEVDVVDFVTLTFLRLTYPRLYQALAARRRALVGADADEQQRDPREWFDEAALVLFDVPALDAPRVAAALRRLFPQLAASSPAPLWDQRRRRGQRRLSDPDYTERYFALTPMADEVSDGVLVEALRELTGRRRGPAADRLAATLRPDFINDRARDRAAQTIRRAAAQSAELSGADSATLIPFVIEQLDHLTDPAAGGLGPDGDAVAWLAGLLTRADDIPTSDVVRWATAPAAPSALQHLLRAIRMAVPDPADASLARLAGSPAGTSWLAGLVQDAGEAAWQRVETHTRLGDTAPIEPVGLLVTWLESALGGAEVDRRIAAAVDAGLPVADLAGRLTEVGVLFPSRQIHIDGFDALAFLRRIGRHRVSAAREQLVSAAETTEHGDIDASDGSWANRRRFAARRLLDVLGVVTADPATLLPTPRQVTVHPFTNHRPSLLPDEGEAVDLALHVAVLLPEGGTVPVRTGWGPIENTREGILLGVLEAAPVSEWLQVRASGWEIAVDEWRISEADGRFYTTAQSRARTTAPGTWSRRQSTPVILGGQLRTGHASAVESPDPAVGQLLLLTVGIGFYLTELDVRHRPAATGAAATTTPLPAAFTLSELFELTEAITRSGQTAAELWSRLNDSTPVPPQDALLQVTLTTSQGLSAVVDLSAYERRDATRRGQYSKVFRVSTHRHGTARADLATPAEVAAAVLRDWLAKDGYRGHEWALHDIWESRTAGPRPG